MTLAAPMTAFAVKRCPECSAPNPVANRRCSTCKQIIGAPDKNGIARRPVAWGNYVKAFLWSGILSCFVWWAFLK
ncbi:MAG: hypothetical protein WBG37_01475 [Desulfobacterales bacterium]